MMRMLSLPHGAEHALRLGAEPPGVDLRVEEHSFVAGGTHALGLVGQNP